MDFFLKKTPGRKKNATAAVPVNQSVCSARETRVDESQRVPSRSPSQQQLAPAKHSSGAQVGPLSQRSQQGGVSSLVCSISDAPTRGRPIAQLHSTTGAPPPPGAIKFMKKAPMLPPGVKLMKGPPPLLPDAVKAAFRRGGGGSLGEEEAKKSSPPPFGTMAAPGASPMSSLHPPPSPPPRPPAAQKKVAPAPILPDPQSSAKSKPSLSPLKASRGIQSPSLNIQLGDTPLSVKCTSSKQKLDNDVCSELPNAKYVQHKLPLKADAGKIDESSRSIKMETADDCGSDSELRFFTEEGSREAISPLLAMANREKSSSASLNPSLRHGNNETSVESVQFFCEKSDLANSAQKNTASCRSSKRLRGCLKSPDKSSFVIDNKSGVVNGLKRRSSLGAATGDVFCNSTFPGDEKHLTPEKQKLLDKVLDSSLSYDCTPELLDHTMEKKKHRENCSVSNTNNNNDMQIEIKKECDLVMHEEKLSSRVRDRIIEQFFSVLSPQQFYGKVTKLHHIRLMKNDAESAPGLKNLKTIYLATKGTLPNSFFYPQLRLTESDMRVTSTSNSSEHIDTPILLYEAAPGNMFFAETEKEARHIMESNPSVISCFVLNKSAIMFKEPLKYVLPIAMLTVQWIPYSVALSEPQCPLHQKELQLFDRSTKELQCALCISKNMSSISDFVVIPEVLNGNSSRTALEKLSYEIQQKKKNAARWVEKHQRIVSVAQRKKDAINQQFDLLLAAIKSKREEFLEQCDIAFGFALSSVAKEILTMDENICLLKAAIGHLRTKSTRTLYSMQVATVANALHSIEDFSSSLSFDSLEIPLLSNELTPNLETVMGEVQKLSPFALGSATRCVRSSAEVNTVSRPHRQKQKNKIQDQNENRSFLAVENAQPLDLGLCSHVDKEPSERCINHRSGSYARCTFNNINKTRKILPQRSFSLTPRRRNKDGILLNSSKSLSEYHREGQWVTIPGCCGTCILDTPIHELLANSHDSKGIFTIHECLQWVLRVDNFDEWIGIGVGVGGNIMTWSASRTPDFSHLWIIPRGNNTRVFILRVTVSPTLGYARLSIHDSKGKRLDDGRIPQWNATRSCYPQVTFSGIVGHVFLTDGPRIVSK